MLPRAFLASAITASAVLVASPFSRPLPTTATRSSGLALRGVTGRGATNVRHEDPPVPNATEYRCVADDALVGAVHRAVLTYTLGPGLRLGRLRRLGACKATGLVQCEAAYASWRQRAS